MARTELPNGVILPAEYSDDWYEDMTSNLTKLDDVIGSDSEKLNADGVDFLRMYSAALTDGGTGNFSDLNSSYKIKTGDLILDSGRKLYKIVSVNSTTETFTVGNSLFKVTAESDLAPVAESGDYDDLSNKPSIPTNTSDLNNDSNFVDTSDPAVSSGITSAKVTDYDSHIADTDKHVTTADKNRWNNQTYVFRYSSTALVASSTNSNALLDNTDNLKVGDKVIDSSGVLFSITAIDTQNSTFTIGTALIDLAQDSDVMHLSGNESASGDKNFQGLLTTIPSSSLWPVVSNTSDDITLLGRYVVHVEQVSSGKLTDLSAGAWNVVELGAGCFFFRSNSGTDIRYKHLETGAVNRILVVSGTNRFINDVTPETDNTYDLGSSSLRWKTINGLNPSSLGMHDKSNGIDISGYLTNLNKSLNTYTPPVNGWIEIELGRSALPKISMRCRQTDGLIYSTETSEFSSWGISFPVIGGKGVSIYLYADSLNKAGFYPCQGNV